jgi:hypothetical protein
MIMSSKFSRYISLVDNLCNQVKMSSLEHFLQEFMFGSILD